MALALPVENDKRRSVYRKPGEGIPSTRFRPGVSVCVRARRAASVDRVPHDFRLTVIRNLDRDGVPRSVAMAMVGHQTEEVYTRYAIVDQAMIQEAAVAAVKMNRGAKARRLRSPSSAHPKRCGAAAETLVSKIDPASRDGGEF